MEVTKKIEDKKNNCINLFNTTADRIGKHLINEFPSDLQLYSYHQIVSQIVKRNPSKPIDLFTEYIFNNDKYRDAIVDGDEDFFKSNRHENLTSSDEDNIKAMFQFKSCWNKMDESSKLYIKTAMRHLVVISGKYVGFMCELQKLRSA